MKKIEIVSSVVNGNLKRNRRLIRDAIATFEGKTISLTIKRHRKQRSNPQNSFYWGIVIPLVQEGLREATGEVRDSNSIHYNILLPMHAPLREIINTSTGEIIQERITSSEMTTSEFMDFIVSIQQWAAEFLNIEIPDPNSENEIQFN